MAKEKKPHIDATLIKDMRIVMPCYIVMRDGTRYEFEDTPRPGEQWDAWLERCGKKREPKE